MIYFIPSILAVFCAYMLNHTKGFFWYVFFSFAILLPSIIYGCRSVTVGTDALVYAEPIWDYAMSIQTFDFGPYWGKNIEFGYLLLNYILAMQFTHIQWLFLFLATVACFVVLKSFINSEFKSEAWLGYAFFLFIFFPESANAIRQGFASAFIIGASNAMFQKKWKNFFILIAIAALFHNVSLLALSFPLITYIFNTKNSKIRQYFWGILLILFVLCGQFIFSQLVFLNDKYAIYVDGTFDPHFSLFSLINLPFIFLFMVYYKPLRNLYSFHATEVYMLIVGLIFSQLSWTASVYLARVAGPFNLFLLFAPMMILKWIKIKKIKHLKAVVIFANLAYAISYFWLAYYVSGIDSLFPYRSEFIDF